MKQQASRKIFFLGILILAAFLLFYKLDVDMPFIGDQGWFYLSARDMLLTGHIPLVGITSSHTWLHQGPLWTYLLAIALFLGKFNPLAGAYLTATIGLLTVWLMYKMGSKMFSPRVGIIASLLYATSPLIIQNERMPYHTSIIPTITLIWFFVLYKWVNGFKYGFPILLFLLTIEYNFELSLVMLLPILLIVLIYGLTKKTVWANQIKNPKIIFLSLLGLLLPMIPMILYDTTHEYPQTVKFAEWIIYKIANFIHIPLAHPDIPGESLTSMLQFATVRLSRLIFLPSFSIAWGIFIVSIGNLIRVIWAKNRFYRIESPYLLLFLFFFIPFGFYIAEKTNSDAYWPVFYPSVIFMLALLFDNLMSVKKFFYPILVVLFIVSGSNILNLLQSNYFTNENGITFSQRLVVAKEIMRKSDGRQYNIHATGPGSQYANFALNYTYLTWWLGHGPSDKPQKLQFFIGEDINGIHLQERVIHIKNQ